MSKTDHQPDRIRPSSGLRRLRRGELGSSFDSASTVLTRSKFHAMLRSEIERATADDRTVLLVGASIRPLPGTGTDLQGRELPDELVERLAAAHDHVRVAALGGAQLVLAIPHLDRRANTDQLVGELLGALSVPVMIDELPHYLGPRLGAARLDHDNPTLDLLQEAAQLALDETSPEQPSMLFHPFQRVRNDLRKALTADLRTAVVGGDIGAAVEPVYELQSRSLVAYRASARWNRPGHGAVPDTEFVELATVLGVDHVLRSQVLGKALSILPGPSGQPNDAEPRPRPTLWFPVDTHQLLHPRFGAMIAEAATTNPHLALGLELSPTPPATDDDVVSAVRALADDGVRIAAGDFGLGNANLTSMRSLGFDAVKLDPSVTRSVGSSDAAARIVGALIAIAAELELETTGQGIETADQLDVLQQLGCQLGQGPHLGEPATEDPPVPDVH